MVKPQPDNPPPDSAALPDSPQAPSADPSPGSAPAPQRSCTTGDNLATHVTRLAPSPTGALHLGNARTFLVNWALAKRRGWKVVLRVEDLDGPRVDPQASQAAIDTLAWLGLGWEGEPLYQSHDLTPYQDALARLYYLGVIYPCTCTRKEILNAQSAPHEDEHELRYPGTCRPDSLTAGTHATGKILEDSATAWRVSVPDEPLTYEDELHGRQTFNIQKQVGDFVVAAKMGLPAYQLAVVVDDARQGVTQVVRGDDLLGSAARQLFLYRLLGLGPEPTYTHLPLVLGPDGRRLAKRHGDTRIDAYRQRGVGARRVIGLLAHWSGVGDGYREMTADEFADRFVLDQLGRDPVTMTQEDQAWLLGGH
jgi:glutamyl-tRNA synthetase